MRKANITKHALAFFLVSLFVSLSIVMPVQAGGVCQDEPPVCPDGGYDCEAYWQWIKDREQTGSLGVGGVNDPNLDTSVQPPSSPGGVVAGSGIPSPFSQHAPRQVTRSNYNKGSRWGSLTMVADETVLASNISGFAKIMLFLAAGYFYVRIMVSIFVGQIDIFTARPGAMADLLQQSIYALIALLLAIQSTKIGEWLVSLALTSQTILTSQSPTALNTALFAPMFKMVIMLVASLASFITVIAVVYSLVRGQLSQLFLNAGGLGASIYQAGTAFVVLGIGVLFVLIGNSAMAHLLNF